MIEPAFIILPVLGGLAAWALTVSTRRYALKARLLDIPNARSSHTRPTPRGGGIAIVVSYLTLIVALAALDLVSAGLAMTLLGAGGLVAVLGFADDRKSLRARWRFLGHAVATAWVLYWLGPLPAVPIFGAMVDLGVGATFLSALYLVWSINLFNFMDGIDGIASLEAIVVSLGGALVWWLVQPGGDWITAVAFAACVTGFLTLNFPPARIFMGDAGSGFLGCTIATLALWSSHGTSHLFWSWFVLGGCFMVDATLTLVRRVARGERFNVAHRCHAYQFAARRYGSHGVVSIAFAAITLGWLLPIAVAIAMHVVDGLMGVVIAYVPLIILAWRHRAGDSFA